MVKCLVEGSGFDYEDAIDFINYNTSFCDYSDKNPIIVCRINE